MDEAARFYGELGDCRMLVNCWKRFQMGRQQSFVDGDESGTRADNRRPGVSFVLKMTAPASHCRMSIACYIEVCVARGVQGHGIGLAIVQDIVRAYRGELTIGKSEELLGAEIRFGFHQYSDWDIL